MNYVNIFLWGVFMKMILQERNVFGIPMLDVFQFDVKEKRPIVILLHGANGSKEKYIERAFKFAKNGFFVTLFDAYGHGELKNNSESEEIAGYDKANIDKLTKVYIETSKYINIIVNSYEDNEYSDSNRIALVGVSMGAFTIYYNILNERNPKVKVAVPINGSPSWVSFVRKYASTIPVEKITFTESDIIKAEKYIETIEPLNSIRNLADFPLLMLNGEKDELIPIDDIRKSYTKLQAKYMDKDKIRFIEYAEIGHTVTPKMLEDACRWIKEYV